jgi:hypothetical protein
VAIIVHVPDGLNVNLSKVFIKSQVSTFSVEGEKFFKGGAHFEHVVLVAADRELLNRQTREGGEGVDNVFDREEWGKVDLAQLVEQSLLGLLKGLSSEGGVEEELIEGGANVVNDVLCADTAEVRGLVIAAAKVRAWGMAS